MIMKQNKPLFLHLQLEDGNPNMYPVAYLYNQDNQLISPNPYSLSHLAHGLYIAPSSYIVQNEERIVAIYLVYEDAAHTMLSQFYSYEIDVFEKETIDIEISDPTSALMSQFELIGVIDGDTELVGIITEC